jgi:hypothetical protein
MSTEVLLERRWGEGSSSSSSALPPPRPWLALYNVLLKPKKKDVDEVR